LNRDRALASACLPPPKKCAACKRDRDGSASAGNRPKDIRIQAPTLDPHVRPFQGTVKLASSFVAMRVNAKIHTGGPIGSGQATLYHMKVLPPRLFSDRLAARLDHYNDAFDANWMISASRFLARSAVRRS
jgi:hypothetical protein